MTTIQSFFICCHCLRGSVASGAVLGNRLGSHSDGGTPQHTGPRQLAQGTIELDRNPVGMCGVAVPNGYTCLGQHYDGRSGRTVGFGAFTGSGCQAEQVLICEFLVYVVLDCQRYTQWLAFRSSGSLQVPV